MSLQFNLNTHSCIKYLFPIRSQTSLHIGASKGNVDCLSLLCKAGGNPNICAKNGYLILITLFAYFHWWKTRFTPLHEACSAGKMECAQILIEYKSAVNIKSHEGFTPLHFACSKVSPVCSINILFLLISGSREHLSIAFGSWCCHRSYRFSW